MSARPQARHTTENTNDDYRTGRPSKQMARKIRNRILSISRKMFVSLGYASTSVEAVAERAKVSKTTIYRHYPTKSDLFRAVALDAAVQLTDDFRKIITIDRDIEDVLLDFAFACYDDLASKDTLAMTRLAVAEAQRFPDISHAVFAHQRVLVSPLIDYLHRLKAEGRMDMRSPEQAALQFLAMASGGLRVLLVSQDAIDRGREIWARDAVKTFVRGNLADRPN